MPRYRTSDGRIVEEHTSGEIDGTRYIWFKYENVPVNEHKPMKKTWPEVKKLVATDEWKPLD